MTHPPFAKGDRVTLNHHTAGTLRLVVTHTEPAIAGGTPWVVATTPEGYGRYRRPATDYARGWGQLMSRPDLSPRQKAVFDALRDHVRRDGHMPILSDLARDLGITYVTLKQHLEALDRKGRLSFVSRGRGRPPLVQVTNGWGN